MNELTKTYPRFRLQKYKFSVNWLTKFHILLRHDDRKAENEVQTRRKSLLIKWNPILNGPPQSHFVDIFQGVADGNAL